MIFSITLKAITLVTHASAKSAMTSGVPHHGPHGTLIIINVHSVDHATSDGMISRPSRNARTGLFESSATSIAGTMMKVMTIAITISLSVSSMFYLHGFVSGIGPLTRVVACTATTLRPKAYP